MPLAPDAPRLPGWLTLPEVAELLGVTKQAVHKFIEAGQLSSLHQIKSARGSAVFLLEESEVQAFKARRGN